MKVLRTRWLAAAALAVVAMAGGATAAPGAWSYVESLPAGRSFGVGDAIGGLCYRVGGRTATSDCGYSGDLHVYDPLLDDWTSGASMPTNRDSAFGAAVDGKLYVAGGGVGCGSYTAALEVYDPSTNVWSSRAPMPRARIDACAAGHGGKLYVFGGMVDGVIESSGLVYDPTTDSWSATAPMPRTRASVRNAVSLGGRLYVIGGADGVILDAVDVYDPATDTWTPGPMLPSPRAFVSAAVLGGRIYVAGGQPGSTWTNSTIVHDPAVGGWVEDAPMQVNRVGHVLVAVAGRLLAIGGQGPNPGGDQIWSSVESYQPEVVDPPDETPPAIHAVVPDPASLWPANNKMVAVTIAVDAEDDGGGPVTSRIVSVGSDQDEGDDDDWVVTGDLTLDLRAQRTRSDGARTYTIVVESADAAGNARRAATTVVVPSDQGNGK